MGGVGSGGGKSQQTSYRGGQTILFRLDHFSRLLGAVIRKFEANARNLATFLAWITSPAAIRFTTAKSSGRIGAEAMSQPKKTCCSLEIRLPRIMMLPKLRWLPRCNHWKKHGGLSPPQSEI